MNLTWRELTEYQRLVVELTTGRDEVEIAEFAKELRGSVGWCEAHGIVAVRTTDDDRMWVRLTKLGRQIRDAE